MKDIENLPLYKKAESILKLVNGLMFAIGEENEYLAQTKYLMRDDIAIICAKIAGAEGGDLYSIRMQNAAIIRDYAMHLYTHAGSLRYEETFKDKQYVTLIRKEIDEFRLLFIDWVANFDKNNYIWDEWALFNPPGAIPPNPNDYQDPINWDDFNLDD
ncbi:MAG: hypothetical protein ACK5NB_05750 [Flavobacteriaceae bacterium]